MATKPLSEKNDYYSLRRMATQDIINWIGEDLPDRKIILKLQIKYGFGKKFFYEVQSLIEEEKNDV